LRWKGDFESPTDKITEVIYNRENISERLFQEISKTKGQIDIVLESQIILTSPLLSNFY